MKEVGGDLIYSDGQCKIRFKEFWETMDRGHAFGRIAFACPSDQLKPIEAAVKDSSMARIQTPFVTLPTPGKADVHVVILSDPVNK